MKNFQKLSVTAGLLAGLLLISCGGDDSAVPEALEQVVSIRGMVVNPTARQLERVFTGTLEGERQAVIRAKISEAVEKLYVREGEVVQANDVIVGLDKNGPSSNYVQSRSVYLNAEKNFNKIKYLYTEGAISESQHDAAETEYTVAKANFEATLQTVELRTPVAGTVTAINVSVGDYVVPGEEIATVATIDRLRMKFGVNSNDIKYFGIGDDVRVFVGAVADSTGQGKVVTVARSADPVTRTFQVEVEVENSRRLFKPGMFARAEIVIERFEDILVVPRAAVVDRGQAKYIYIVRGDRVHLQEISLGTEFNGYSQAVSGLNPGDTIVTIGQDYLSDDFRIKLIAMESAGKGN